MYLSSSCSELSLHISITCGTLSSYIILSLTSRVLIQKILGETKKICIFKNSHMVLEYTMCSLTSRPLQTLLSLPVVMETPESGPDLLGEL